MKDNKELKQAFLEIEKKFGKEAIMLLGEKPDTDTEVFSTGSLAIDNALGIGGFPKGRIIEIFGPESSGKTTITLHAIAEVQKNGGVAAFIDAEHSIDPQYARNLGIDIDNLILSQPDSGEQALDIVDTLVKTGAIDLIVVDSVAALVPLAELNGEMKDQVVGAQPRLMSKALRKITGSLNKNGTTIIFINQIREKVGVLFGNPETTPGGRALKFYSSIRLDVRKNQQISTGSDIIGNMVKIKVVKNKLAIPFKTANVEIVFAQGISKFAEIAQLAEEYGIVSKKGAWYSYNDQNIAQGKTNFRLLLENNNSLYEELRALVKEKLKNSE
ncbi:recombinase RecA [Mesomycoplasma hyorhinis]|uniref:Protein RecA n=2 Tax=Mesomycoplasma hyorhinis TaxID=2100 RepID=A0AAJ2YP64_MESHY|nr:recombinase RecA [Mesomycoplasma hyorhinis]AFX74163.1 RecA protein [Mesomycoplasma hyorhinis SK76]MXR06601.1 recombinase RecA [Mesomycoplasma hyorhinis]MXR07340.1 recombinase RecA [Mesomycoplasma hyorhinis]MXR11665.1 recombinase RecA [Mesomycoplasma hyorhinis]MXR38832.1 recombinase RecA [Mesomycoplasma hyorhinis]